MPEKPKSLKIWWETENGFGEKYPCIQGTGYGFKESGVGQAQVEKRDLLLKLIGISGEFPVEMAGTAVGSKTYAAYLATQLKKEGYISVRKKDGIRGYTLKAKGRRELLCRYPGDVSLYLEGLSETNHVKSEPQKRLRLHRMSMAWIFFYRMGLRMFLTEKPGFPPVFGKGSKNPAYYGAAEFKRNSDRIKGSRACGLLLCEQQIFVVYHSMDRRMKWAKKMERSMRSFAEGVMMEQGSVYGADAVMIGNTMDLMPELLESDGGLKGELFQVDDVFEHYYYFSMEDVSRVQFRLVTDRDAGRRFRDFLCQMLEKRADKEYALPTGYDENGNPVYFCYELELRDLMRIRQEMDWTRDGKVVCLDFQTDALRTYLGKGVEILAVSSEKVMRYIESG